MTAPSPFPDEDILQHRDLRGKPAQYEVLSAVLYESERKSVSGQDTS